MHASWILRIHVLKIQNTVVYLVVEFWICSGAETGNGASTAAHCGENPEDNRHSNDNRLQSGLSTEYQQLQPAADDVITSVWGPWKASVKYYSLSFSLWSTRCYLFQWRPVNNDIDMFIILTKSRALNVLSLTCH